MGRDIGELTKPLPVGDFNPLSPCGERPPCQQPVMTLLLFQSTLPVWGETGADPLFPGSPAHFNPLSPCGERRAMRSMGHGARNFNPLSPCGERPNIIIQHYVVMLFQSTLPVWGETSNKLDMRMSIAISIHSPRVGRDLKKNGVRLISVLISIHSPRVGRDKF